MAEKTICSTMAVGIAAAVQRQTLQYIRLEYGWLPWVSLQPTSSADELILELRGEGFTLSCFFEKNDECCQLSYLFPDTEKDLVACVDVCHQQYRCIAANLWMNYSCSIFIRLLHDAEVGQLLIFEAVG